VTKKKAPVKKAAPKKAAKKDEQKTTPEVTATTGDAHPAHQEDHRPVEDERAKQGEYKKFADPETTDKPVDFYAPPWEQSE